MACRSRSSHSVASRASRYRMWLWFSFTACSAKETKLAPTVGIRTALQYCRTLACSRLSVGFFIGCLPVCRPATDRNHPSPAWETLELGQLFGQGDGIMPAVIGTGQPKK